MARDDAFRALTYGGQMRLQAQQHAQQLDQQGLQNVHSGLNQIRETGMFWADQKQRQQQIDVNKELADAEIQAMDAAMERDEMQNQLMMVAAIDERRMAKQQIRQSDLALEAMELNLKQQRKKVEGDWEAKERRSTLMTRRPEFALFEADGKYHSWNPVTEDYEQVSKEDYEKRKAHLDRGDPVQAQRMLQTHRLQFESFADAYSTREGLVKGGWGSPDDKRQSQELESVLTELSTHIGKDSFDAALQKAVQKMGGGGAQPGPGGQRTGAAPKQVDRKVEKFADTARRVPMELPPTLDVAFGPVYGHMSAVYTEGLIEDAMRLRPGMDRDEAFRFAMSTLANNTDAQVMLYQALGFPPEKTLSIMRGEQQPGPQLQVPEQYR